MQDWCPVSTKAARPTAEGTSPVAGRSCCGQRWSGAPGGLGSRHLAPTASQRPVEEVAIVALAQKLLVRA